MKYKGIIYIFLMLGIASCTTQRDIDKVCSSGICPTEIVYKTDSIYIETIDTIYRTSQLDSLMFVSSLDFSRGTDTIYFEDETWKGTFYVTQSKLKAKIEHLSDSISTIVKTKTIDKSSDKTITVVEIKEVDKPIRDRWYYFLLIVFILLVSYAIFRLVLWIKLGWLKNNIAKLK